jgi:putative flippase GtrA
MLQEYLKLNKNILIAFAASIIISAIIAQVLSDQTDYLNTTYTTIADYVIYFSVFSSLFYLGNRKKYRLESGGTDTAKLKHDLKKLITSLGIAEVVYTVVRWALQYYFLSINYDPYLASIISQGISTIVYMIVLNVIVKITRLYKDGS